MPLLGFCLNFFFGKALPKALVGIIGCGTLLVSFICTLVLFKEVLSGEVVSSVTNFFPWIKAGSFVVDMGFLIDRLSVMMLLIVTGVGFLIHLYSTGYMHDDEGYFRYFAYLNLFVFFMQVLVTGSSYVVTFIGWEGVGLCSYLLIGFWFKNQSYNNAAKKAFIMNRIGDLGFLIGIFWIFNQFGSVNYLNVFEGAKSFVANGNYNDTVIIFITVLLFIGATGKSAQLPLYTWLPDAMAGPTPVSALIHAATMVTAGIYVIVRSHILFSLAPFTLEIVAWVGGLTALFAASIGIAQNDIKKVLAYSTVSQLGLMFLALGVGAYGTAMFHLMTHAFFKALLFLGAGSVIHAMGGEQDIRKMGGLRKKLPTTFITFFIATLAISGIPPFAGFFSKDEILAEAFAHSPALWVLGFAASLLTAYYMFRLLFLTFYGSFRGTHEQEHHLHESPFSMTIPLMVLALLSTIAGFIGMPEVFGSSHKLREYLSPVLGDLPKGEEHALSAGTEIGLMAITVALIVVIIFVTRRQFIKSTAEGMEDENQKGFFKVLAHKYYVDELYDAVIVRPADALSGLFYSVIDVNIIDGIVNGAGKLSATSSRFVRRLQSGSIGFYLFAMVVSIILIFLANQFLF
jgi:NADH-quinone oxidoreductase subunit L